MATRSNTVLSSITNSLRKENAESNKEIIENTGMTAQLVKEFIGSLKQKERKDEREKKEGKLEKKKGDGFSLKGMLKSVPTSGLVADFFSTALSGSTGLFSAIKSALTGTVMMGLGRGLAALLVGPQLFSALKDAFEEKDLKSGIGKFLDSFFSKQSITTKIGTGAALGFAALGPKGIVPGMLLGASFSVLQSVLGEDAGEKLLKNDWDELQGFMGGTGIGAMTGAYLGFKYGGGLKGIVPGILLGGAFGALAGVLTSKDTKFNFGSILTAALGTLAGAYVGVKVGAMLGMVGGPLGMVAGALLGGALGLVLGSLASGETEAEKTAKKITQDATRLTQLEAKAQTSEGLTEVEKTEMKTLKENIKQGAGFIDQETSGAGQSTYTLISQTDDPEVRDQLLKNAMIENSIPNDVKSFNENTGLNIKSFGELFEIDPKNQLVLKKDISIDKKDRLGRIEKINYKKGEKLVNMVDNGFDITGHFKAAAGSIVNLDSMRNPTEELTRDKRLSRENSIMKELLAISAPGMKNGGVFTQPKLVIVGESPKNNPEIIFNRQQLEALGSLFQMQYENDAMRRGGMGGAMISTPVTQYVDNRTTMQESFNVTEILPAPSTYSFGDHLPA